MRQGKSDLVFLSLGDGNVPGCTIHFGVPNMTLMHLYDRSHPNNLNQLISFAESQNTENIANVISERGYSIG